MHAVERKVLLVKPIHEEAINLKTITVTPPRPSEISGKNLST